MIQSTSAMDRPVESRHSRTRRLRVFGVPLARRQQDILALARHFVSMTALRDDAEAAFLCHDWAGNVRELQNRIQLASLTAGGPEITARDLGLSRQALSRKMEKLGIVLERRLR